MAEERRRKVHEIQAVVADVREETHDAASLLLDIGDEEERVGLLEARLQELEGRGETS